MRKAIDTGNGLMLVSGSNRPIQIEYATPEWADEPEPYFRFMGNRHYLGNIMRYHGKGYDGIDNWSTSNGMLVKFNAEDDNESVFAYYYFCVSYDSDYAKTWTK